MAASLADEFDAVRLFAVVAGSSLIIACGCVINNYIDRDIDKKMARTSRRSFAANDISVRAPLFIASVLGVLGFIILLIFVNSITASVGALGLFFYLVPYSYFKRKSHWGTVVGSVSGSTPILAGYTSVSEVIDAGAILLFLCMVCWQMPHFYAIAMYRQKEYRAATIPVLPVARGRQTATLAIYLFIVLFVFCNILLTLLGYTGFVFAAAMTSVGLYWLAKGISASQIKSEAWGRMMFLTSLFVLLLFCVAVSVGSYLP